MAKIEISCHWFTPFRFIRDYTIDLPRNTEVSYLREMILALLAKEIANWIPDEFDPEYDHLTDYEGLQYWVKTESDEAIKILAWGEVELFQEPDPIYYGVHYKYPENEKNFIELPTFKIDYDEPV